MTGPSIQHCRRTEPDLWQAVGVLFEQCPHAFVQQSPAWAEAIAPLGPDRVIFLLAGLDGRPAAALPLYAMDGPAGTIVTSVPQAGPLGGIFVRSGLGAAERDAVYGALLREAEAVARAEGAAVLSIITNPLDDDIALYRRHLAPDLEFENFTQVVRVTEDALTLTGPTATRVRYGPRHGLRARRLGQDEFERWYALHLQRHGELGAPPLPEALLRALVDRLENQGKAFVLGVETAEGALAASGLFVLHKNVCDVFITAMDRAHARLHPNYLLTAQALQECADRGVETLNWQSSAARGNGVYRFKAKWKAIERPYWFVTKLLAPIEPFLALGKERLGQAYPWHYVLPFGLFDQPEATRFRKP